MGTRWEKLAGNTDVFALKLSFVDDPDEGMFASHEESVSWGEFQIWVEGQNLCAHSEDSDHVGSVHWYLLYLLEWVAVNWDALLHEERLPNKNAADNGNLALRYTAEPPPTFDEESADKWEESWYRWMKRHSLISCRSGGIFPEIFIRRWRHLIEVSWGAEHGIETVPGYKFTAEYGCARLDPAEVAEPLYEVLKEAVDYLNLRLPQSDRLEKLKSTISKLTAGARQRRLALLAGLGDTVADAIKGWRTVVRAAGKESSEVQKSLFEVEPEKLYVPGSCYAALMFGSVAPNIGRDDVIKIAQVLVNSYSTKEQKTILTELVSETSIAFGRKKAWEQGYDLAHQVLGHLNLLTHDKSWIDIEKIVKDLGIHLKTECLSDRGVRAIAVAGPDHTPTILFNQEHDTFHREAGKRFTLAHELCHILFDRIHGQKLAMASGPWAPLRIEQRANAFAAMFLMPSEIISRNIKWLQSPLETVEGIIELSSELKTSPTACLEHIYNLAYIDETMRDTIRAEWGYRAAENATEN